MQQCKLQREEQKRYFQENQKLNTLSCTWVMVKHDKPDYCRYQAVWALPHNGF